jgi:hypothetical protein
MRKIENPTSNKIFIFFILLLSLTACSNREQTDFLGAQGNWVQISSNKSAKDNSSDVQIKLNYRGENIQAIMSCKDNSVQVQFKLQNTPLTTTIVYIAEDAKWVKGAYFAFHKRNSIGRPKHLAIERVTEDHTYDLNIPIPTLVAEGKPDLIEAQFSNGEKLVISFNELASTLISKCIEKEVN